MNVERESAERIATPGTTPTMRVVGVGGAGLQAVAHMAQAGLEGVAFAVAHTDARQLAQCPVPASRLLGVSRLRGLGAGGDPEVARAAAEAEAAALREWVAGQDLVVIVAGLGGGTGSGVAPVLAALGRENGALVLALVTLPFEFEGVRRQAQAQAALRHLRSAADAVVCLPNQKVAGLVDESTPLAETFRIANDMLAQGLRGLWRLITRQGLINVDFADLCRVVRGRHAEGCFATAEAAGEQRARALIEQLPRSPLLDGGQLLTEAESVLVSLAGGPGLTLKEVNQILEPIHRLGERAHVIVGAAIDPALEDRLTLTVVAARKGGPAVEDEETDAGGRANGELVAIPGTDGLTGREGRESERPPPRYVPPAPQLTRDQAEQLWARQGRGSRRRKPMAGMRQELLPLEVVTKGRFAKSQPTIHAGEDLDTPTYVRRGMALN